MLFRNSRCVDAARGILDWQAGAAAKAIATGKNPVTRRNPQDSALEYRLTVTSPPGYRARTVYIGLKLREL